MYRAGHSTQINDINSHLRQEPRLERYKQSGSFANRGGEGRDPKTQVDDASRGFPSGICLKHDVAAACSHDVVQEGGGAFLPVFDSCKTFV